MEDDDHTGPLQAFPRHETEIFFKAEARVASVSQLAHLRPGVRRVAIQGQGILDAFRHAKSLGTAPRHALSSVVALPHVRLRLEVQRLAVCWERSRLQQGLPVSAAPQQAVPAAGRSLKWHLKQFHFSLQSPTWWPAGYSLSPGLAGGLGALSS